MATEYYSYSVHPEQSGWIEVAPRLFNSFDVSGNHLLHLTFQGTTGFETSHVRLSLADALALEELLSETIAQAENIITEVKP